jgi:hypothetical protein
MAGIYWRLGVLVTLFIVGASFTQQVKALDEDIPPLRTKEKMSTLVWLTSPIIDFESPPVSSIPRNRPFKAIGLEVRNANPDLAEFARRAMDARLKELGVGEQVHVIHPPNPGTEGSRHPAYRTAMCCV